MNNEHLIGPPLEDDGSTPASWVIQERSTGRAIFETFNGDLCRTIKPAYEMIPIRKYLAAVNAKIANQ